MAYRYPLLKSIVPTGATENRRRYNPAEAFGAALKRYIASGYKAPQAMKAVWHDVRLGRVARPTRRAKAPKQWRSISRKRRGSIMPLTGPMAFVRRPYKPLGNPLDAKTAAMIRAWLGPGGYRDPVAIERLAKSLARQVSRGGFGIGIRAARSLIREAIAMDPRLRNPRSRRRRRILTVPEQHQLRIARQTLRMHPAMARVMGGPTPTEARRIIRALRGNPAPSSRGLAEAAMQIAARGAREYLAKHNLDADPGALLETLRAWVKIKIPEALADAKAALNAGMTEAAEHTFAASMVLAGIEAAKEAGFPRGMAREPKQNPRQRVSRARFCSERVADPQAFDRRSLRTVVSRAHRVTVGCPRGQYDAARRRCRVGTRIQRILHPEGEGRCPIGGREARNPRRAAGFCHETIQPRGRYDRRSFRTVLSRGHRVVIGCPKGAYARGRCQTATEAQAILHPEGEGRCPFGSPARVRRNPPGRRARLSTFYDRLVEIKATKGRRAGDLAGRYRHRFRSSSKARGVDRGGWRRMRRGEVVLTGRRPVYARLPT